MKDAIWVVEFRSKSTGEWFKKEVFFTYDEAAQYVGRMLPVLSRLDRNAVLPNYNRISKFVSASQPPAEGSDA